MALPAKKLSYYSCLIAGVVLTAWTAIEWAAQREAGADQ